MERIGMDLLGPLPQSRQGNKFILIVSDYFTRWIEAYPIPDIQAHTICRVFIAEFISRYGIPRQIHTDRGAQFTSQWFKEICDAFRIDKTFTTALHPQSDGLVERFNRTVEDMLSKVVSRDQKNWDEVLPMVMLAYRTSEHDSTGQTPSMMMFGREAELPIDLLLGLPPHVTPSTHSDYVTNLINRLDRIHTVASKQMEGARDRQKRNYNIKINKTQYPVGALVCEKKRTFDRTKCDQSYDLISQLKRHHSDRHGPRWKCNNDGCIFTCPESRRYMLRNHMSEQHAQYITAPMVNSEKYPLSPLRSPTPISLYEPTDINGKEFDFLYNACQESGVNLDFEPPRKVLIHEQPSEKGDANNNTILTPVSLKPRDLTSE
ncbi:unnamed protein product [Mytilus coruscus]|uniref:Integrase catalytic domain-containing protein n=1 Tax=Mytilus coruscus TaxID=42192 RepID=A0A6J8CZ84_MYTCO|nr:unnamed protein product [Mytilus coruscus]